MPIKRPPLVTGEIYHIVMRGVEKRIIFPQEEDYFRFIHDLFEFNDENAVGDAFRKNIPRTVLGKVGTKKEKRRLLVEILIFCLMPNHFHLLLYQLKRNGISNFMRKMGGYATYINKKYRRVGHLYQGRFRAVHIKGNNQLKNVFVYIHTNPVELIEPEWKEGNIQDLKKAIKFLENYRYSSYLDYIGKKNFPSVINKKLFREIFPNKNECRKFTEDWILYKYRARIRELGDVVLE